MRTVPPEALSNARLSRGPLASTNHLGMTGGFRYTIKGRLFTIMASDASDPLAQGWEHVSVSTKKRCPTWGEMCHIKKLFWCPDETVLQFHPAETNYVNIHNFCLHMWKPPQEVAMPPLYMV